MTLHLPGDGWFFLVRSLRSPFLLVGLGLILLAATRARVESAPLLVPGTTGKRHPATPTDFQIGTALLAALLLEGLLPRGPWWGTLGLDLLTRNLLILLLGFDLIPRLITGNPLSLRGLTGRIRPVAQLFLLGVCVLVLTGLGLWGLTIWFPVTVRIGAATGSTGVSMLAVGLLLQVGLIPLTEEWVFRGGLYRWLRGRAGPAVALVLSAGIFALLHGTGGPWLYTLAGGLVMAGLVEGTGSILPGLVVHAGMNFLLLYGELLLS